MNPKLDLSRQNAACAIRLIGGARKLAAHYVGCTERTIRGRRQAPGGTATQVYRG